MFKWNENQHLLNRLLELDAAEYKQELMAKVLGHEFPELFSEPPTRNAVKNALAFAREKASYLKDSPKVVRTPYYDKYRNKIKGIDTVEKNITLLESLLSKSELRILILSDLHIPFTDEQKLQKAIDRNRTADMVILGGDTMDGYNNSRHRKRTNVPHEQEVDETIRIIEYLAGIFPWVRIIRGNHDSRAMKKIQDTLSPELLYLFDEEPLDLITKPFENVEYIPDWYTKVNDLIVAHAERSSSYEGRPAILLSEWFLQKGWSKRLNLDQVRVFVQAHTHQVSAVYREDLKMMECGSMLNWETAGAEYVLDPTAFMRPPMNGFVNIIQYNGKTNFNQSREYVL